MYFQSFRNSCLFCTFCFFRNLNSADSHHANYGKHRLNHHFQHCLFCTFCFFRNLNSADSHHANYGKHRLNHHFQHCAHCAYDMYSICKVFEIAVCFANFVLFEIWTALILTMPAMVNVVQFIISNIAHSVYMRFTVFSKLSKLLFFLHIFLFVDIWTPLILTMVNVVPIIISNIAHTLYMRFTVFSKFSK